MSKPKTIESLQDGKLCYVLLPGSSGGIHHPLMQLLYERFVERHDSVVAVEYPYQTNDSEPPENDLSEEINALKSVVDDMRTKGYERFVYVCKSLGGLVSTWLMRESQYVQSCDGIYILGCVIPRGDEEGVDPLSAKQKIRLIVQGELDEYGNAEAVSKFLQEAGCTTEVVEIKDGDHSYRHLGKRDVPAHESEAVDVLFSRL